MKTKTLLAALGTVIGLGIGLENMGSKKTDCEVYQGYTQIVPDADVIYVFDPEKAYSRRGPARYVAEGDPALRDSLRIGEKYCFELMDPIFPLAYTKLKSVNPAD